MKRAFAALKSLGLYYVAYTLIVFAIVKFFGLQFQVSNLAEYTRLKDVGNWDLAWAFFNRSTNYNLFIGILELIGGTLILFKKTRLIGLLIVAGLYTNIVLIDFEFKIPALQHAMIEFIIVLVALLPYFRDLKTYFWDMGGQFTSEDYNKSRVISLYFPIGFICIVSIIATVFYGSKFKSKSKTKGAYSISEFSINETIIDLRGGKNTKQPMVFFDVRNMFTLTTNERAFHGDYYERADSIFISFDQSFMGIQSLRASADVEMSIITGITNDNREITVLIEEPEQ